MPSLARLTNCADQLRLSVKRPVLNEFQQGLSVCVCAVWLITPDESFFDVLISVEWGWGSVGLSVLRARVCRSRRYLLYWWQKKKNKTLIHTYTHYTTSNNNCNLCTCSREFLNIYTASSMRACRLYSGTSKPSVGHLYFILFSIFAGSRFVPLLPSTCSHYSHCHRDVYMCLQCKI